MDDGWLQASVLCVRTPVFDEKCRSDLCMSVHCAVCHMPLPRFAAQLLIHPENKHARSLTIQAHTTVQRLCTGPLPDAVLDRNARVPALGPIRSGVSGTKSRFTAEGSLRARTTTTACGTSGVDTFVPPGCGKGQGGAASDSVRGAAAVGAFMAGTADDAPGAGTALAIDLAAILTGNLKNCWTQLCPCRGLPRRPIILAISALVGCLGPTSDCPRTLRKSSRSAAISHGVPMRRSGKLQFLFTMCA